MSQPEIPGAVDDVAEWGDEAVRVTLIKTSSIFGAQPVGARYEAKGRPGSSRSEVKRRAFQMLKRSLPDENPGEWEDEQLADDNDTTEEP